MRDCLATKILSIVMIVLTPAALLMAETGNTMLYASGSAMVNGAEVSRTASVVPGDKIETAGASAVTVNQDGSKVTVNPYSAIRYQDQNVAVVRGTAAINTSDGMAARAAQITVAPKDKAASYEVAVLENKVLVTSRTGALLITEAGRTTELAEGGSSSLSAEPAAAAVPAPAPAPVPQAAPVFPGSGLSKAQAWTIAAVVGGASAVCGLWCGKNASTVPPGGFGNGSQTGVGHVSHGTSRAMQVVTAAVVNPIATGLANKAGNRSSAHPAQQHRNIRAGR